MLLLFLQVAVYCSLCHGRYRHKIMGGYFKNIIPIYYALNRTILKNL